MTGFAGVTTYASSGIEEYSYQLLSDVTQYPTTVFEFNIELDTTLSLPDVPTEPVFGTMPVASIPNEPEFTADVPTFEFADAPAAFSEAVPDAPSLTNIIYPSEPELTFPAVPTLTQLNLPDVPSLDMPEFNELLPDRPSSPDIDPTWAEVEYQSLLLTSTNNRLYDIIDGIVTNYEPSVEDLLWHKARDAEMASRYGNETKAASEVAARGFYSPSGVLLGIVEDAKAVSLNKLVENSRELMREQLKLQLKNFQMAFGLAISLESELISHHTRVMDRSLEFAKFVVQSKLSVFEANVSLYLASARLFAAQAEAFKAKIEATLAELEVQQQRLEAQRLLGEINEQQVRLYIAQIGQLNAMVDIYRTRVEVAKLQIAKDVGEMKLYSAKLKGVESQVKAKNAEIDGYVEQLKAETAKVELFATQADAFKSQADAFKTLVQAKLQILEQEFKQKQAFPLEVYKEKVRAFKELAQAEFARVSALADIMRAKIKAFEASNAAQADVMRSSAQLCSASIASSGAAGMASVAQSDYGAKVQLAATIKAQADQLAEEQIKAMTTAAFLSANTENHSENVSESESFNVSDSYSRSWANVCATRVDTNYSIDSSIIKITEGAEGAYFLNNPSPPRISCE